MKKSGIWHVIIDRDGEYIFELRRWPRESGLALQDGLSPTKVTDSTYVQGSPLDSRAARIRIGDREASKKVEPTDQSVEFVFDLKKGESTIQRWFNDRNGESICGAYYVYVEWQ